MQTNVVDYPTFDTDYLPHVIARCLDKANRHQVPYRFTLNGAMVVVSPGQSAHAIDEEVQRQWLAARQAPPAADAA